MLLFENNFVNTKQFLLQLGVVYAWDGEKGEWVEEGGWEVRGGREEKLLLFHIMHDLHSITVFLVNNYFM